MEGATGPAVAQLLKLPDVEWKASLDSLQGLPAALETDLSLGSRVRGNDEQRQVPHAVIPGKRSATRNPLAEPSQRKLTPKQRHPNRLELR